MFPGRSFPLFGINITRPEGHTMVGPGREDFAGESLGAAVNGATAMSNS